MFGSWVLRPIASVVLVTFTALTLQPLTAAAQLPSPPKRAETSSASGEERFSRTLNEIHEILKEVVPQAAMPHRPRAAAPATSGKPGEKVLQAVGPKLRLESEAPKPLPGVDVAAKVKTLRAKYKELKSLEAEVSKGFKETEKHIRDKNLPAEIFARHGQAVAEYEKRKAEFNGLMQVVEAAADGKGELQPALANLGDFMAKYPNAKTHTPTDPNNLPWGSPKPVTRAPYTSPSQFKTSRLFGDPVKVAQAGSLSGISLPSTTLPATPNAGDLAATEDVQITQAIRDLATSLGNKPVPIYNWVRNNIQFVPSYGSIQGSDMTLQTKRGNSFDTASLLIALFRSAGIPARYVYGTIEVPADKAMNWVGGVTVPQAAMNLMGQGGIPVIGVTRGGQIGSIRLEHVWVEAYVDYVPSRGAVNRAPNTWAPMDASFKQYEYTAGMNLKTSVPFDASGFIAQAQQSATVNQAEGWVQNVNQAFVQQTVTSFQTQLTNYVSAQKTGASVNDALGGQTILAENRPILLGTLPYARLATGAKFQTIPDNLRWKYRYNIYASDFDQAADSPIIAYTQSAPSLAGKKLTLSFSPATAADLGTIASYLPRPHADGSPIDVSEVPTSLPGYLISMVPQLRVEGQAVASAPAFRMGTEIIQIAAFFNPASGQWEGGDNSRPIVGEIVATALDLQGIGAQQLSTLQARLQGTGAVLTQFLQDPSDPSALRALTKEQLIGDLLYSAAVGYFTSIDDIGRLSAKTVGAVSFRMPSYGNFSASASPQYYLGVPRNVAFPGLNMDMKRIIGIEVSTDNSAASLVSFRRLIGGQYSAQENGIPDLLFTDPTDPNRLLGFSAVKALAFAGGQGQRIYLLNQQNQPIHDQALAQLAISSDVKQEIANALAVGREVTVHQSTLNAYGFTGVGYTIIDPDTGAGAYKISGGTNGDDSALDAIMKHLTSFGDVIAELLEHVPGVLAHFVRLFLSILSKVIDFANIVQNCSGAQLVEGLAIMIGTGIIAWAIIGWFGAFFVIPGLILFLYWAIMAFVIPYIIDSYVEQKCKTA